MIGLIGAQTKIKPRPSPTFKIHNGGSAVNIPTLWRVSEAQYP